jgi:hypothetical protein
VKRKKKITSKKRMGSKQKDQAFSQKEEEGLPTNHSQTSRTRSQTQTSASQPQRHFDYVTFSEGEEEEEEEEEVLQVYSEYSCSQDTDSGE